MIASIICTVIVVGIALFSLYRYRGLNSSYDRSRPSMPSDQSFQYVYGMLIIAVLTVTIIAYWSASPWLLQVHDFPVLRLVGIGISILGIALFEWSARALGSQYSPCFDLRRPSRQVTGGPYRLISHPMYAGNIGALVGLFISSGSLWLMVATAIVATYYWRSARRERGTWIQTR